MYFQKVFASAVLGFAGVGIAFAQTAPPAPNPNLARNLAAQCANCHGTDGKSDLQLRSCTKLPRATPISRSS
jgi:cytochrome c553